jgi:protease I
VTEPQKHIAILIENQYQDLEFWYPYYRLQEAGAQVLIVGPEVQEYKSRFGYPAQAERAARDVRADDFDGIIIPGGFAPDLMRRDPDMVSLVSELFYQDKIVAAICHAGWLLSEAGILEGKTVTSFFSIRTDMENAGARWIDNVVVRDGNLITARIPSDLPAFCRELVSALGMNAVHA